MMKFDDFDEDSRMHGSLPLTSETLPALCCMACLASEVAKAAVSAVGAATAVYEEYGLCVQDQRHDEMNFLTALMTLNDIE